MTAISLNNDKLFEEDEKRDKLYDMISETRSSLILIGIINYLFIVESESPFDGDMNSWFAENEIKIKDKILDSDILYEYYTKYKDEFKNDYSKKIGYAGSYKVEQTPEEIEEKK